MDQTPGQEALGEFLKLIVISSGPDEPRGFSGGVQFGDRLIELAHLGRVGSMHISMIEHDGLSVRYA